MDSTSSFYTAHEPRSTPLSSGSAEVAQESLINSMMGVGRQGRAAMLETDGDDYDHRGSRRPSSVRSQQYHDDSSTPSFVTARESGEPVGTTSDIDLFYTLVGGDEERRVATLPLRSRATPAVTARYTTPEAEDFYRSSAPYTRWMEAREDRSPVAPAESSRPLTPFPRTTSTSRRYATMPIPSNRERAYIDNVVSKSLNPQFHLQAPHQRRARSPPPPRLPHTYRAETAFSFDRPPTTTPFSSADATSMSPSHRLYNAPRIGGVQLEVNALQKATEGRGAVHRALWPEEREEMLGEVDGMAGRLVKNVGRVKTLEIVQPKEGKGEERDENGNEKVDMKKNRKGKFGWVKRFLGGAKKKKEVKEEAEDVVPVERMPATRPVEDDAASAKTDGSSPARPRTFSRFKQPSVCYNLPSARQERRNFSNDTTVVATSTSTVVVETPSPPQPARQSKVAKRSAPALFQKQKCKRRHWWQVVSRGRIGCTPNSQEMLRRQTSLVIQKSQRSLARPRMVAGSTVVPDVVGSMEPAQGRISLDDYFDFSASEESIRVGQVRDV